MIRLLIACFAALFVSSCLDSHEEVWLNDDASGKARIKISIPAQAARMHGGKEGVHEMIAKYMQETPAFSTFSVETTIKDDRLLIDLSVTFKNAMDLPRTTSSSSFDQLPNAAQDLAGHSDVHFRGLSLNYHRKIDLTRAIPGSVFIPKDQLKSHAITTILHLPKAASNHNADSTADAGKTLIWSTPMSQALRDPIHQSFTMPLPIPWVKVSAIILMLVALVAGLYYYICRRKRMRIMRAVVMVEA
jgi:hypothetical protein